MADGISEVTEVAIFQRCECYGLRVEDQFDSFTYTKSSTCTTIKIKPNTSSSLEFSHLRHFGPLLALSPL
jgi:hypothetical protein